MNQFNILTIYPDFFQSFNKHGLIKKALDKKIIDINTIDLLASASLIGGIVLTILFWVSYIIFNGLF